LDVVVGEGLEDFHVFEGDFEEGPVNGHLGFGERLELEFGEAEVVDGLFGLDDGDEFSGGGGAEHHAVHVYFGSFWSLPFLAEEGLVEVGFHLAGIDEVAFAAEAVEGGSLGFEGIGCLC